MSVDGVIAIDGDSSALSSNADRAVYRTLREQSDAVVVGARTAEHPAYARLARPFVIVSQSGNIQTAHAHPIVITTTTGSARVKHAHEGASIIDAGASEIDFSLAHARLLERGLQRLLCEGGPTLLAGLLSADLIDELCLTVSPQLIGSGQRLLETRVGNRLRLTRHEEREQMLFLRYRVEPSEVPRGRMQA